MRRAVALLVILPFALCIIAVYPLIKSLDWALSTLTGEPAVIGTLRAEFERMKRA